MGLQGRSQNEQDGDNKMSEIEVDAILTSGDVARLLGVEAQTVWLWTKAGKIVPDFYVPGGARFRQSEVERFKAEQTALATASKNA